MTSQLTRDDARAIARILYAARQRRTARLAAEHADAQKPQSGRENRPGGGQRKARPVHHRAGQEAGAHRSGQAYDEVTPYGHARQDDAKEAGPR